jgi:hypothetical protein
MHFAVPTVCYFDVFSEDRVKERKEHFAQTANFTHWMLTGMGSRAVLHPLKKRKIRLLYWELNPGLSVS